MARKLNPTSKEILDELNELRLLVLQEGEDGKFRQVMLSPERFKRVSDAVSVCKVPTEPGELNPDYELHHVHFHEKWEMGADAFLGLSSIYEDADKCEAREEYV